MGIFIFGNGKSDAMTTLTGPYENLNLCNVQFHNIDIFHSCTSVSNTVSSFVLI